MSDEGEKTCPLCAEEMDLTDQQLRPCKCGYDICVWCWHHIMDMAEKDDTEGRCPACRTPYNKEKIVGTASKCERLVSEMSVEKKQKSLKGKTKTSEGRKQLSSVRVIQRNLVYIVGLPLNLADEDLLQRKEYFGQYGKVLKVSISRTAAGSIQHFANNTCSVYITYSKEDEAVRSIQSVHGFVLEGRSLRACFGTTKYCHAWLRNMPCTNPDCLYLHEFGSQEDSFTKDEIISEYTRGRVQQVTGITNDIQRRSGNFLPPAADDYSNNTTSSWAKPISKTPTNDTTNSMKVSPPNSSSGRSVALPAAASWGTHASNSQPLAANAVSSNGTLKQKVDTCTSTTTTATLSFSTAVVSPSSHSNGILKNHSEESKLQHHHPESATSTINSHLCTAAPNDKNDSMQSSETAPDKDKGVVSDEEGIQKLSSLSIGRNHGLGLQPCEDEKLVQVQPFTSNKPKKGTNTNLNPNPNPTMDNKRQVFCLEPEPEPDFQNNVEEEEEEEEEEEVAVSEAEAEADLLSFNDQRLRDPEVVTHTSYIQNVPQSSHVNQTCYSPFGNQNLDRGGSLLNTINMPVANGHSSNGDVNSFFEGSNGHSYINKQIGMFDDTTAKRDHHISSNNNNNGSIDLGENSIISNILSMDFDPWDESLTSPQNLAKLLGNNSDKQERSVSSRKTQNCNQSRFSFAREEDQGSNFNFTQSFNDFGQNLNHQNMNMNMNMKRDFVSNTDENGFSAFNFEESDNRSAGNYSSNKISVSRSQISAPPGFMGPSRAPPPGFTSNERIEQTYDNLSGNHMFESGSIMRKMHQHQHQHQAAAAPVYNGGELELMDPAILAIGGSRVDMMRSSSNFPSQQHAVASSYENDNRLRLLMQSQRSSFTHQTQNQNQRFSELGLGGDGYGVPSRILEQNNNRSSYQQGGFQQPRISNGHWDGWNEVGNGNDIAMAELLRNERLGFNKYYSSGYGYEDTKFRMPSSGDLYNNRTFGI